MRKIARRLTLLVSLLLLINHLSAQQGYDPVLLKENWAIQSSDEVSAVGSEISKPGFQTNQWYPATMPSTILEALVNAGVYKDPYYGNNFVETPGYFEVHAFDFLYDLPEDSPFSVPWRNMSRVPDGRVFSVLW